MADNVFPLPSKHRALKSDAPAGSHYGQIRLTVSFSPTGKLSYRALAKRPQDDWRELDCFAVGSDDYGDYPPSFHDALERFALVAQLLRWMPPAAY